jgi:malonyl-CoA O-methyltransferase
MTDPSTQIALPVADAYDRWSATYDAYDNPMVFAAAQVLRQRLGDAPGHRWPVTGLDIVEFGCGTGRNLAALKSLGARSLTGLDLSQRMLDVAAARDTSFALLRHDMTKPAPLDAARFDLVLFCLSLEHVGDLESPLREARRLLRPGGTLMIVEIHPSLSKGGIGAHFTDEGTTITMPVFAHGLDDYARAFASAGLTPGVVTDWRARDFDVDLPAKLLKRGPDAPWIVELTARA